jgi:hypothetical protein
VYVFRDFVLKWYGAYLRPRPQEEHQRRKVVNGHQHQIGDEGRPGDDGDETATTSEGGGGGGASVRGCSCRFCCSCSTSCPILDVAGGKGDLSWLLCNADELDSFVVDPRAASEHRHMLKSVRYLRDHPDEASIRAIPGLPTHQPLAALMPKLQSKLRDKDGCGNDHSDDDFVRPGHLRVYLNDELVEAVRKVLCVRRPQIARGVNPNGVCATNALHRSKSQQEEWRSFWASATRQVATSANIIESDVAKDETTRAGSMMTEEIEIGRDRQQQRQHDEQQSIGMDADDALRTILGAKLIVGFHPDQATDGCVDLAELLGVPFCIVPCCVFPHQFPHRRLRDGTRVRTYEQLIKYLKEKCPKARTEVLDFHFTETAKNLVVFTLPGECGSEVEGDLDST